ncbi:MAG: 5-histidylcysteine sulfoxide synthase [Alphaproteobacteria bacterium]|nr:5-histidylcysteine sulfoxide synthase [Alphaproteobacteria bacterium]
MRNNLRITPESTCVFEWTGLPPLPGVCPGVDAGGQIHSLPLLHLGASRSQILDYFNNGWTITELLFSSLASTEAFYRRPYHQLRHPMIFYFAHPAVVYVNKLRVAGILDKPVNAAFEALFEVGVDEMRWDDLHESNQAIWPTLDAVVAYRRQVHAIISELIQTHPFLDNAAMPVTQKSPMWALVMGFEHERIHIETSSVLIREMPVEYLQRPSAWPALPARDADTVASPSRLIPLPGGEVSLGKPTAFPSFGWDNEYGSETRTVRAFEAGSALVSNGEFLEFVKAGGYGNEAYWSREGWAWRRFRNIKWPTFWVQNGPAGSHLYALRTLFEIVDMPWDWPANVNFHEAKAYCAWRTAQEKSPVPYRLLTEAEHHAIRDTQGVDAVMSAAPMAGQGSNFNLAHGSENAVTAQPANSKGFHDVFGNVWQWCEDHFHPLEGSNPHPYYDDFSTPCYDGEHQMILGGSFISTGDLASIWARFHFRPHFFQHAGFRLARHTDGNPASSAKLLQNSGAAAYESSEMLNKYLLMHWGSDHDIYENVPLRHTAFSAIVHLPLTCAELIVSHSKHFDRVLDLGCAVGRSSFELARNFTDVLGIDYSREFIESARTLQAAGMLDYQRKDSGATSASLRATVDPAIDRARVRFEQGDACALPLHIKDFDAVLLANVLCRLPEPLACLERMQGANALVKRGGVLVMTTPFSWLEEYTPRDRWLDGISAVGKALTEFELIEQHELPFLIREHQRKFEYIVTLASVWRRKN